jgi:hypothetical protein
MRSADVHGIVATLARLSRIAFRTVLHQGFGAFDVAGIDHVDDLQRDVLCAWRMR